MSFGIMSRTSSGFMPAMIALLIKPRTSSLPGRPRSGLFLFFTFCLLKCVRHESDPQDSLGDLVKLEKALRSAFFDNDVSLLVC